MDRSSIVERTAVAPLTWSGISNALLGTWLFLASEVMFFTGLLGACLVLRSASAEWPVDGSLLNRPVASIATGLLLLSSFLISRAVAADRTGHADRRRLFVLMALAAGGLFMALQGWEVQELITAGFSMRSSLFASSFLLLMTVHALHILAGLAAMVWCVFRPQRTNVAAIALYLYFVNAVWLTLFVSFYIL